MIGEIANHLVSYSTLKSLSQFIFNKSNSCRKRSFWFNAFSKTGDEFVLNYVYEFFRSLIDS